MFLCFLKKAFLIFVGMKLSNPKNKKFQEGIFWAEKHKTLALKNCFIFWEMGFLAASFKRIFIFQEATLKSQAWKNFLFF